VAWGFLAVPVVAIVVGFRRLGRTAASIPLAVASGASGGVVFAGTVIVVSLAGSLWLSTGQGGAVRRVAIGPDPVTTAALAFAWGVVGGAIVSAAFAVSRRFSRRARPR
jgi:hypothetical protein